MLRKKTFGAKGCPKTLTRKETFRGRARLLCKKLPMVVIEQRELWGDPPPNGNMVAGHDFVVGVLQPTTPAGRH